MQYSVRAWLTQGISLGYKKYLQIISILGAFLVYKLLLVSAVGYFMGHGFSFYPAKEPLSIVLTMITVILVVLTPGLYIGMVAALLNAAENKPSELLRCFKTSILYNNLLAAWGLVVGYTLLMSIAAIMFLVPAIYFGIMLTFAFIVFADSGVSVKQCFIESNKLVGKAGFFKILSLVVLTSIATFTFAFACIFIISEVTNGAITSNAFIENTTLELITLIISPFIEMIYINTYLLLRNDSTDSLEVSS